MLRCIVGAWESDTRHPSSMPDSNIQTWIRKGSHGKCELCANECFAPQARKAKLGLFFHHLTRAGRSAWRAGLETHLVLSWSAPVSRPAPVHCPRNQFHSRGLFAVRKRFLQACFFESAITTGALLAPWLQVQDAFEQFVACSAVCSVLSSPVCPRLPLRS
jgi:hypothetical protein